MVTRPMLRMLLIPQLCYALVFFFACIVSVGGTCTWQDFSNTVGAQSSREPNSLGGILFSIDQCKAACEGQSGCVAVDYDSNICSWYSTVPLTTSSPGSIHAVRTCPDATTMAAPTTNVVTTTTTTTTDPVTTPTQATPAGCSMTENANTGVTSPAQVSVALSSPGDCETLCKGIPQCRGFSHSSSTCDIHASDDVTASSSSGYVYAAKVNCVGNGENCCFEETQADTKGTASTTKSLTATVESCKSMCLAVSSCQGVAFSSNTCSFYAVTPSIATQSGSTYFSKTCAAGADQGSLTIGICGLATRAQLSQALVAWTLAVALLLHE